ncbi:MAG: hypothetical protein QXH24_02785 [Candidatus Bathyarchaeia archaeon]
MQRRCKNHVLLILKDCNPLRDSRIATAITTLTTAAKTSTYNPAAPSCLKALAIVDERATMLGRKTIV